jgi:hypothetical protein
MFRRSKPAQTSKQQFELDDPRYYFASGLEGATFEPSSEVRESYCASCRERTPIIEQVLMRSPRGTSAIIGRCATCHQPLSSVLTPTPAALVAQAAPRRPNPGQSQRKNRRR